MCIIGQPVKEIFERVKQINTSRKTIPKILLHTDAAPAIGKIPVSVQDLGADYLTVVGHKVHVAKGILNKMYRTCSVTEIIFDLKNEIHLVNLQYFLWHENDHE